MVPNGMFRFTTYVCVLVTMAALVAGSTQVRAQAPELKLNPTQRKQLRDLGQDLRGSTSGLRLKLLGERKELMRLYSTYDLDEKKVRAEVQKVNDIQYSLLSVGLDHQLRLRKIVSADQFEVLSRMQKDRMRGFGHEKHGFGMLGGAGVGMGRMRDIGHALEQTDITPEQRKRLKQLHHAGDAPERPVMDMMNASKNVQRLYDRYQLSQTEARAAIRIVNRAQFELMMMNLERQKELRKILTPEQFAAVWARASEHHQDGDHR